MCGIIGIANSHEDAFLDVYDGLLMLQHRGQDAAGMVTYDGTKFQKKKGKGLVKDVFSQKETEILRGNFGIGHVRYPTAGSLSAEESQPFFVNSPYGIYLIHNGNLVNTEELEARIVKKYKRYLDTKSDSELLLNKIADEFYREIKAGETNDIKVIQKSVTQVMKKISGAYSIICLIDGVGLVAFRDPNGIRPLSFGHKKNGSKTSYAFASEDVAFRSIEFEKIRDIKPGELVIIDLEGNVHEHQCVPGVLRPCIFEYIYLSRPDSMLDEISVYKTQLRLGEALAKQVAKKNLEIDSIIPIPDSSRPVALEMSKNMGIKYREGLVKNRYVGRTFIMSNQNMREKSVYRKLSPIHLEFKNRNILLVDDSIVRGTTIRQIVQMCRKAGAKKVYVASAAPPVRYPNVYGIDMSTQKELIASGRSIPEICKNIGADELIYQTLEDTILAAHAGNPKIKEFDCSCFDGKYITGDISTDYLEKLAKSDRVLTKEDQIPLINI